MFGIPIDLYDFFDRIAGVQSENKGIYRCSIHTSGDLRFADFGVDVQRKRKLLFLLLTYREKIFQFFIKSLFHNT